MQVRASHEHMTLITHSDEQEQRGELATFRLQQKLLFGWLLSGENEN